ncbi:MAG: ABC transporter ATP-binding protein/permease [Magnetospirillum sp. WYHS-4]
MDGTASSRKGLRTTTRKWAAFFAQFLRLAGPYWTNPDTRWQAHIQSASLTALTVIQVGIPIAINKWSERLFDALEQKAMDRFLFLIGVLGLIIAVNVVIVVTHLWVKRKLQVTWRAWLTHRILGEWMASGRHYQLGYRPGEHDNPDGRIAEDVRIATETAVELAHSLLYCLLLLVSFTAILWDLSGDPELHFGGYDIYLPGHLVWIALLYTGAGTTVAWLLGQPLVGAANRRQKHEANFRFGLAHSREYSLEIALQRGEAGERRNLLTLFKGAVDAWNRQTKALASLFFFTSSWSVLTQVFPVLVAAPRYIGGTITLGVLMQTSQAFQQMVGALSWPIDNLANVANWRASVDRVLGLHDALDEVAQRVNPEGARMIRVEVGERPVLSFDELSIADQDGETEVEGFSGEILPGQRVLISGDPGTCLKICKAVAGLWPWGGGRLRLPCNGPIFFMPQQPYLPLGTLKDALTYPAPPGTYGVVEIANAFRRVGLEDLFPSLDDIEQWADVLSVGEQQRLGFARLLLFRPNWIFIQEALDSLEPQERIDMMQLVADEFPDAGIITVSHHSNLDRFHPRSLALTNGDVVEELAPEESGDGE